MLGTITLKFEGEATINCDCVYKITGNLKRYDDTYDFEMHKSWHPIEWVRNIETLIGRLYHGYGEPYDILIRGSKSIDKTGKLEKIIKMLLLCDLHTAIANSLNLR